VASLPIVFAPIDTTAAPPAPSTAPPGPGTPAPGGNTRTLGWILAGSGGALVVGSGVLLLLRHQDISTLNSACPGGLCPPTANQSDLTSTHDRAVAEGPVAGGLAAAGVVAAAVGVYFLVTSRSSQPVAGLSVTPSPYGTGLAIGGSFR
jgi:hypothetical protein